MRPTNAQILEGRDEALDHLGISLVDWETSGPDDRRQILRDATHTATDIAAAQTVIEATIHPASPEERMVWVAFFTKLGIEAALRATKHDFTLRA